jgi:hypothetical protein
VSDKTKLQLTYTIIWLVLMPVVSMGFGWIGGHVTVFITGDFILKSAQKMGIPTGGMSLPELCAVMAFVALYLGRPVVVPMERAK